MENLGITQDTSTQGGWVRDQVEQLFCSEEREQGKDQKRPLKKSGDD